MAGFFSKRFLRSEAQGCVVVAGHMPSELTAAFAANAQQQGLSLCQFIHSTASEQFVVTQVAGAAVLSCCADLTDHQAIARCMQQLHKAGYFIDLAVIVPGTFKAKPIAEVTAVEMQQLWKSDGLMAAAIAQAAIQHMLKRHQGTLVFLGAGQHMASSDVLATQVVSAGVRALSQSLAREFQPQGLHISYLALKNWDSHELDTAQGVVETCWHLYRQPHSTWSQALSC